MDLGNPFEFQFIRNLKSIDVEGFDDRGASVVFASPGMVSLAPSTRIVLCLVEV